MEINIKEIADNIGGIVIGNAGLKVSGISGLKSATQDDLSFILSKRHLEEAEKSASRVLISDSFDAIAGKTIIKVKNAKSGYAKAISLIYPDEKRQAYISKKASVSSGVIIGRDVFIDDFAVIKDGVVIGDGSFIGAGTVVAGGSKIGKNVTLYPNISIYRKTEIGDNTMIHSGTVIGADGFGFVEDDGKLLKVPQIGAVKIGMNVEIGANCCIDRAAFGLTRIGNYVKIDNLVHIAHSVEIGDGTIVVAQSGIAGSTTVGRGCVIGGQVGIADHVVIGDGAQIGSQSGIGSDVEPGAVLSGSPARPLLKVRRAEAYTFKLEDLFKRVKALEEVLKKDK
jgi:UDP-3-O-[3-hydroxymyristoyl] glucosamine N-acyltransferase